MNSIHIQGGVALRGKVSIQGSKNAALPILAATLLTKDTSRILNCPRIADVYCMLGLLKGMGAQVCWEGNGVRIDTRMITVDGMTAEAVTAMRSSLCLLGPLIARCGEVVMEHPGGCVIGARPIDIHLAALGRMGVCFMEQDGLLWAKAEKLHGAHIMLPFPSVGATENVILAAVLAEGTTLLEGAAREPEVVALCEYLNLCGASIEGAGNSCITVCGTKELCGANFRVPADRIVAGTYLFGALATGGCVLLEEAPVAHMHSVLEVADKMGAECTATTEGLFVQGAVVRPGAIECLRTEPYPGFPTDLQSPALAALTLAEGESVVEETIFENRFRIVEALQAMGARIRLIDSHRVVVCGVERLQGTRMEAMELRGGAALLVAALAAEGESVVKGCSFIDRGYENICKDLRELGARVISV